MNNEGRNINQKIKIENDNLESQKTDPSSIMNYLNN